MTRQELKETRSKLGFTQSQLAMRLGVDAMRVSEWERGVHGVPKFLWLALLAIEQGMDQDGGALYSVVPRPGPSAPRCRRCGTEIGTGGDAGCGPTHPKAH
jgi:transcriptional regulator with XRE-family HTH domain